MDVAKPCEFIGFGAMDLTKTYEFIRFGAMDGSAEQWPLRRTKARVCEAGLDPRSPPNRPDVAALDPPRCG